MKRWLRRIAIVILILLVVAVVAGASYEWLGRRAARRDFPPPGTLVDIGGRRLQMDCRGTGSPIVVLESGLDISGSLAFAAVHDSLAAITRSCAYSRAGIMWSDPSPEPFSARQVAEDLRAALEASGEEPPYVLVGHSLGGPLIVTYTRHFPGDVAGLVMVDASHPRQLEEFRAVAPSVADPPLTPIRVAAALSWAGVVRAATSSTAPMPNQGADVVRAVGAYASTSINGALREMDALAPTLREAGEGRALGDRPLVVLTATRPLTAAERAPAGLTEEEATAMRRVWKTLHEDEASWSTRSRHELVDDAGHYIQFDRPDVVVEAVRSVVHEVRATTGATMSGAERR